MFVDSPNQSTNKANIQGETQFPKFSHTDNTTEETMKKFFRLVMSNLVYTI